MKKEGLKILIVGGGGREHALAWKIRQSPRVTRVYCMPGNPGIAEVAKCVPARSVAPDSLKASAGSSSVSAIAGWAASNEIDLTVVGPEAPLVEGIVDEFERQGLAIFGPTAKAAEIEGSKVFAKDFMRKYGIPTAAYGVFEDPDRAEAFIRENGAPVVVKADGLAAGKGVTVASSVDDAVRATRDILSGAFGQAGHRVVIEEFLEGEEVSVLAFSDGKNVKAMPAAQDHKRALDGDCGPNTGGMGTYSPVPAYTPEIERCVLDEILRPTVAGMAAEGRPFKGVLFAGLMLTARGPKVLEFNARFGDPETQSVLRRMETDLVEVLGAVVEGRLDDQPIKWKNQAAACIVLASGGYPGSYQKGKPIDGLAEASVLPGVQVFHAGTAFAGGGVVTSGGRVLGVSAVGEDVREAQGRAYEAIGRIKFEGMQFRRDIGYRALRGG